MDADRTSMILVATLMICVAHSYSNSIDQQVLPTEVPGKTISELVQISDNYIVFYYSLLCFSLFDIFDLTNRMTTALYPKTFVTKTLTVNR